MSFWWILYIAMIISIVFIEQKKPSEAILWLVIILLLPVIGIVLYLILGSTLAIKFTRIIRAKKLEHFVNIPLSTALEQSKVSSEVEKINLSPIDKSTILFNINYNRSPLVFCDYPQVFPNGASHYKALFEDIRDAKEEILVEFYTIHSDQVGHALVDLLAEKAKQGVQVKVLIDFIANITSTPKMFRPLKDAGGKIYRVKPYLTHYRSHRKIVVIDNRIGYIGGMNIGKQYINFAKKKKPWRDTQVRLTGSGVNMLTYYFYIDWVCAIERKKFKDYEKLFDSVNPIDFMSFSYPEGQFPCQFVTGGVDSTDESIKNCYLSLIRGAEKNIRIQSPYFIPDNSVLDALKVAAASGVKIDIIIPGVSASFFLTPVTRWYIGQLMAYGAKVHLYNGYMHAKTMVIDEEITCIGSVNLDIRSLLIDDEICGLFYDNSFAKEYIAQFEVDVQNSYPYTYEAFQSRSALQRVEERFFLLFAPLM